MRAILHNHWLMAFSFNILKVCFLGNERMNVSFFHGEGSQWIWGEVVKQNNDRAIFIMHWSYIYWKLYDCHFSFHREKHSADK